MGGKRQLNSLNLVLLWFEQLDDWTADALKLQQECLSDRTDLWCYIELLLLVLTVLKD